MTPSGNYNQQQYEGTPAAEGGTANALPVGKAEDVEFSRELADAADRKALERAEAADRRAEGGLQENE
ncbi:YfhD family protein [Paenibacillus sp. y28]|uniref:YfhD family protein n=1 Tax=Paenibacillus sp. y28 TaxID=3129110 RepID=UPI0030175368